MENEVWKDIEGYEGLYQVSNLGRVKHLATYKIDSRGREWRTPERLLTPILNRNGYYRVSLSKEGRGKYIYIHRLVATAFIPNLLNRACIDHINTVRTDNYVNNLRWVDHQENMMNLITRVNAAKAKERYLANHRRGQSPFAIKIVGVNKQTGKLLRFDCIRDVIEYNFCESHVAQCIRKERKSHKGYKWYRQDEYYGTK